MVEAMASESGAWSETSQLQQKQSADIQNQTVSSMVWSNSAEFGSSQLCRPEPRNIAKAHLP
jgi:hypothetical protein